MDLSDIFDDEDSLTASIVSLNQDEGEDEAEDDEAEETKLIGQFLEQIGVDDDAADKLGEWTAVKFKTGTKVTLHCHDVNLDFVKDLENGTKYVPGSISAQKQEFMESDRANMSENVLYFNCAA